MHGKHCNEDTQAMGRIKIVYFKGQLPDEQQIAAAQTNSRLLTPHAFTNLTQTACAMPELTSSIATSTSGHCYQPPAVSTAFRALP
jgi:hypothetical protein